MSFSSRKRTGSALLTLLMLSGCSATERLNKAATTQGQIAAGIDLPDWPADCDTLEPHASISVGAELRSVLVRERQSLDRQNARTGRCSVFYRDVKIRYAGNR